MFGRKIKYELVKFSEDDKYRVTMLKGYNGYIVFCNEIETNVVVVGGKVGMTADEADIEYNKMCIMMLSNGEKA